MRTILRLRPIPGWDRYLVSDRGDVYSLKGRDARRLSATLDNYGYPRVDLYGRGRGSRVTSRVYLLVALAFLGDAPGRVVNHRNGDKRDARLSNLEFCTHAENTRHGWQFGLRKRDTQRGQGGRYISE